MVVPPPDEFATQLRAIPQVDRLGNALDHGYPHWLRVEGARSAIAAAGEAIRSGQPTPSFEQLAAAAAAEVVRLTRRSLGPVINATGVLLHTNLGRAPLAEAALRAVHEVSAGYSNLEYDLALGTRGSRYAHSAQMLAGLTGAEAALVVNNNAAAVLLALRALSRGKEAIISRGELIEIGGEFRIPEIMQESGAILREVGTTNRTHLKDYERAIGPETGVILKVHPSNYEVTGFTASVASRELAALAGRACVRMIHDIGSGLLSRQIAGGSIPGWLAKEPVAVEAVAEGADIVTFSGDKLFGGPQAGLIVGNAAAMAEVRKLSLLRTFRTDKTTLAALDATLRIYRAGQERELPFWRMALASVDDLAERSQTLVQHLPSSAAVVQVVDGYSTTGGGSAPSSRIPTPVIQVLSEQPGARALAEGLLRSAPPVVARIESGALEINLRTVDPPQDRVVAQMLSGLLSR
ncbi:MAG: L-seryl-tRNA(Sec) selenium transferase [Actinomycetota bacterium]